jgi:hypothetical protein
VRSGASGVFGRFDCEAEIHPAGAPALTGTGNRTFLTSVSADP